MLVCVREAIESARLHSLMKNPDRFLVLKGRSFSCAAKSNPIKRGVKPHGNSRGSKGFFSQN
jgi:hypothetical protein